MPNAKNPPQKSSPPSREFMQAVLHAGSISVDCELCDRTHFVNDEKAGDFEEGELERLRENYRQNPDKYVSHNGPEMISYGYLAGKQVVDGCPPVIWHRNMKDFIGMIDMLLHLTLKQELQK
ncbi:MAG TPA: hypothetical protein VJH92_00205 [Candidatus Nanoarchaeia archaeon]|nr:hypothetical protein [Candidatus Nanoarchaeia archaeon]